MIKAGDLVVPIDEKGALVRPFASSHFARHWSPDRPALVLAAGTGPLRASYVRKLQVLLDDEPGWVSEVFVKRVDA